MNLEKPPHDYNPYQTPESVLYEASDMQGELLDEPNRLPAGSGLDWLKEAWAIFMARPLLWVGFGLFYVALSFIMGLIPVLNLLWMFLNVYLVAGVAYMAYQIDVDEDVGFGDLFVGFQHNGMRLLWLSVLSILLSILMIIVMILVLAVLIVIIAGAGMQDVMAGNISPLMIALIVLTALACMLPMYMMLMYSPILILLHDMPAFEAMKLSFKACLRNILPFIVYGLLMLILVFLAGITLGLGLLVAVPVIYISFYISYKQTLTNAQS